MGYSRILSQEDPEVGRLCDECFVLAGLGTSNRGGLEVMVLVLVRVADLKGVATVS